MNALADEARSTKRRRLDKASNHQFQAARLSPPHTQYHMPLVDSPGPHSEPERYTGSGARPRDGVYLLNSVREPAHADSRSRFDPESPECCYGMVREKSVSSFHISARALILSSRSYVTSP
jgi:hypothetical protein